MLKVPDSACPGYTSRHDDVNVARDSREYTEAVGSSYAARASMVLNLALMLGVLSSLLGLSELMLRESQRAAVRNFVDDVTLRVHYLNPIRWFNELKYLSPLPFLLPCVSYVAWFMLARADRPRIFGFVYLVVFAVLMILIIALPSWWNVPTLLTRMQGTTSLWGLMRKALWLVGESVKTGLKIGIPVALLGLVVGFLLAIPLAILEGVFTALFDYDASVVFASTARVAVGLVTILIAQSWLAHLHPERLLLWRVGVPLVLGVIVAAVAFAAIDLILKIVRAVLWRIAEFQKGPVAAITLIATTILALIKLFVT